MTATSNGILFPFSGEFCRHHRPANIPCAAIRGGGGTDAALDWPLPQLSLGGRDDLLFLYLFVFKIFIFHLNTLRNLI